MLTILPPLFDFLSRWTKDSAVMAALKTVRKPLVATDASWATPALFYTAVNLLDSSRDTSIVTDIDYNTVDDDIVPLFLLIFSAASCTWDEFRPETKR